MVFKLAVGGEIDMNLIEKLKDINYVRAYGLMKPEEQEFYNKVGVSNCLTYMGGEWMSAFSIKHDYTYCIKPSYNPEPEYIDYEIKLIFFVGKNQNLLGIEINHNKWPLYKIPSMPNFEGFIREMSVPLGVEQVSKAIREEHKVYARIRV